MTIQEKVAELKKSNKARFIIWTTINEKDGIHTQEDLDAWTAWIAKKLKP